MESTSQGSSALASLGNTFGGSADVESSSDDEFDIDQSILKQVKAAVGR